MTLACPHVACVLGEAPFDQLCRTLSSDSFQVKTRVATGVLLKCL